MAGDPGDPLVGRTLGEFVIRARLGEGGFGIVYRATQTGLEREAVVKVMTSALAGAGTLRFLREAKLASRLDHPYAAHIYAFGAEPDGVLWIAMELVRGTSLGQLLSTQGTIALERFLPLLERICEVVHTAHEQGIVHRDIKPANVMVLSRAGRYLPKLLDFGIAKARDSAASDAELPTDPALLADAATAGDEPVAERDLTLRGDVMGSPFYMAPEQWMDASSVDARTDVYALAVMTYECLTGKPPFTGATLTQLAVAHATATVPPLGEPFPRELDTVLERALAKRADDRHATALELAVAFREASGISADVTTLPELDEQVRDDAIRGAPHPIAEGVAMLEAARNAHQARDSLVLLVRTTVRYVALLAIACRTRIGAGRETPRVPTLLAALRQRTLDDAEWLELASELVAPFRDRRDAYPVPELVDILDHGATFAELAALEAGGAANPRDVLATAVPQLSAMLRTIDALWTYPLVVITAGTRAERWMGVRRQQRAALNVLGRAWPAGEVLLLDRQHAPILTLSPLFQLAAPSPGAGGELFMFEGRGRRGAKLAAWPTPFEHHDEGFWDWYRASLAAGVEDAAREAGLESAPYLGLSTFTAADTSRFFGREVLVDACVNRLRVTPLLAVVGRSGAGKSSFVQAGVVPALGWRALVIRPGPSPLATLAAKLQHAGIEAPDLTVPDGLGDALRRAAAGSPLVLVIDQLEELFTLCHDASERTAFATAVVRAARSHDDPVRVIVTLRDDFLVRAEQLEPFRARLGQGFQLVTVPSADDLLRTLVEPARRAGFEFEDPALPREMVAEVADQPSALPLLSFTASKLWELRDRHFKQLTRTAYGSLGGVGGALAQHAEATIEAMSADERRLVRETFRHLVTSDLTRATLTHDELTGLLGGGDSSRSVIEQLVAARLLTLTDGEHHEPRVEIAHEALLVAWPRLVGWAREDAEGARLRDQLRTAARQWDDRQRSRGLLWRGDALAELQRWRHRHGAALTDLEQAFASASLADAARGRRIRRSLLALAFVALALAIVLLWRSSSQTQAKVAQLYEEQGRQHLLAGDALRASVYLVAAKQAGARGTAIDFMLGRSLAGFDREQHRFVGHTGPLVTLQYTADGERAVTSSYDGTLRLWDGKTGAVRHVLPGHDAQWLHARFSDDGTLVASGGGDGGVRVWNAATGALVHRWTDHARSIESVELARDGQRLLSASSDGTIAVRDLASGAVVARWQTGSLRDAALDGAAATVWSVTDAGALAVWDAATGRALATPPTRAIPAVGVAFDPLRRFVVTGEASALAVWDATTRERIATLALGHEHRAPLHAKRVTFSPDGALLAVATVGGVEVWAMGPAFERRLSLPAHRGDTTAVAFSADGVRVATAGTDGFVRLYDLATGSLDASLDALDQILAIAFAPDGRLAAASLVEAIVWSPTNDVVSRRITKPDRMRATRFSPDGSRLAAACADGTIEVRDAATFQVVQTRAVGDQLYLDWAPSGAWLAVAGIDGTATVLDAATLATTRTFHGHHGEIRGIDVSPDGRLVATADEAGAVRIWDAGSGQLARTIAAHTLLPTMVTFDQASQRLASAGRDRAVRIWDVASGALLQELRFETWVMSVAFIADGRQVLVAAGRTVSIWDLATRRQLVTMDDHQREVRVAQLVGDLVMTASFDTTAKLWDRRSGRLLATFERHRNWLRWGELDATGTRLVTSSDDHSYVVWELPREVRPTATLSDLVSRRVPFRLRDEILVRRR